VASPLIGGLKADIAITDNASAIRNGYCKLLNKHGNMIQREPDSISGIAANASNRPLGECHQNLIFD
jgi:hypothetical protein